MTDTDRKLNVHEALVAIMLELPAIGKEGRASEEQGGYRYRGIEQITRELQPLLSKHGVIIAPRAKLLDHKPAGGMREVWTDTLLQVDWLITGPDGSTMEATTIGWGRDNSDKGCNKGMTQAYKYLLLDLFCIADTKDDSDGQNYEQGASGTSRSGRSEGSRASRAPSRGGGGGETAGGSTAVTERTFRSPQEGQIILALDALDAELRKTAKAAFKEQFTVTLSNLAVDRHQEAAEWLSAWLDENRPPA